MIVQTEEDITDRRCMQSMKLEERGSCTRVEQVGKWYLRVSMKFWIDQPLAGRIQQDFHDENVFTPYRFWK